MSQVNEQLIDPLLEESEEENDFEIDAALNALAMNTLTYMNEQVSANSAIPEAEHAYIMLHAAEAVAFNIIMHIAESAQLDPLELAIKTKDNLIEAIESMSGGCCGGGEHHHH